MRHKEEKMETENRNMLEKKDTVKFPVWITLFIILTGAIVTISMYSLIQGSFFKATVTHEMELMQIMEKLGSQLIDSRIKGLKFGLEDTARQYREELVSAPKEEIEPILSSMVLGEDGLGYCYQTQEARYCDSLFNEENVLSIDLAKVWEGETVLFAPDFNEKGQYILAIAAPVWENRQEGVVDGILIEYLDGYSISRWMWDLFSSLDFGTAYIVNEEGRNIATAREENYDWITTRYNAQELAKENRDEATISIARLEKRALDGETGVDTYEWEGSLSYVAYGPLEETDWGFCVGFYGSQFEEYTREVTAISSRSAGMLLAVFVLFLATLLTIIMKNLHKERRYNKLLLQQKEEIERQALRIAVSEERFRIAMQRSSDIILEYQLETGEISRFYGDKEVKSGRIGDAALCSRLVEGYSMDEDAFSRFQEAMRSISRGLTNAECTLSGSCQDERKWYKMSVTAVSGSSLKPTRAVGILRDVTSEYEAELDPLTRLYNKSAIMEYVKSAMQNNAQQNISMFAMIDVDHFKKVNDQYGHPVGDRVLREVAGNLQTIFPKPCLTGRFGGDEFCVYCLKSPKRKEVEKWLRRLSKSINEIHIINNADSVVSISIGAVIFSGYAEFDDIYKAADEALYNAKKAGRDRYYVAERI